MTDGQSLGTENTPAYVPSPRPDFAEPTLIRYADVTRHIWGDAGSGEVFDWIYASTDRIHALVFGLAPGEAFRHSPRFRTVFGADEVLHVLSGTMLIANPATGEVVAVPSGESVSFGPDTWHHAFAYGPEPLRVLEFLAPPPAAGTTGAYARTKPLLTESRYCDDAVLGRLSNGWKPARSFAVVRRDDRTLRLEGNVLVGLIASTASLTAGTLTLPDGAVSSRSRHDGDEVVYVVEGVLTVRVWHEESVHVFELAPGDAAFLPRGAMHEYRNYGGDPVEALMAVAPSYLDPAAETPA